MEFLRDENTTNNAGQVAYDQWVITGMSAPVEMDFQELALETTVCTADWDGSGAVNIFDILAYLADWQNMLPETDLTGEGSVNIFDILAFLDLWQTGCP